MNVWFNFYDFVRLHLSQSTKITYISFVRSGGLILHPGACHGKFGEKVYCIHHSRCAKLGEEDVPYSPWRSWFKSLSCWKTTTLGFLAWEASEETEFLSRSFMGRKEGESENVRPRGGACGKAWKEQDSAVMSSSLSVWILVLNATYSA